MSLAGDRPEFAPPPQRGNARAIGIALLAHALLIGALTWGVRWKREGGDDDAIVAELWTSTVQRAAANTAVTPPPPPAPTPPAPPAPEPPPPPPPPPPPAVRTPPPAPAAPDPDIALEREKRQREQQAQREREQDRQRQQAEERRREEQQEARERERDQQRKAEARKREQDEKRREDEQRKLAEEKKREAAEKQAAQKAAADKQAAQKAAAEKAAADKASAAAAEKARQANIARMMGQAGGSAEQNSGPRSGQGQGAGGPSGAYFGRVAALIKRNVVFDPNSVSGNPAAEFEIRTSPDGTIVGTPRLIKSSGNPAWDDAALRAIQRTEVMPRDTDGRVPSPFPPIVMRPKS